MLSSELQILKTGSSYLQFLKIPNFGQSSVFRKIREAPIIIIICLHELLYAYGYIKHQQTINNKFHLVMRVLKLSGMGFLEKRWQSNFTWLVPGCHRKPDEGLFRLLKLLIQCKTVCILFVITITEFIQPEQNDKNKPFTLCYTNINIYSMQ